MVPVERVQAIYARESGQGMSFPVVDDVLADVPDEVPDVAGAVDVASPEAAAPEEPAPAQVVQLVTSGTKPQVEEGDEPRPPAPATGRPALKRVK